MIGRQGKRRWWNRADSPIAARDAPDLDLVVIALDEKAPAALAGQRQSYHHGEVALANRGCLVALALCAVITLVAMQWLVAFEAANRSCSTCLAW